MNKNALNRRTCGCPYDETPTIARLDVLAERILADLPSVLDPEQLPARMDFSIHIVSNLLLRLNVGGLPDTFTFADWVSDRYSQQAVDLISYLNIVMESYNWTNPEKPIDRRFFCSVYLADEADYHSIFWTPGVARIFLNMIQVERVKAHRHA